LLARLAARPTAELLAKRNDPATTAENRSLLDQALQQQQQQRQQGVQQGTVNSQPAAAAAAAAAVGSGTVYIRERDPRIQHHERQQQGHPASTAVGSTQPQQQQQYNGVLAAASSAPPPPPAFLQPRSSYSRRHRTLVGVTKPAALLQLSLRLQRQQQQLLGHPPRQPDLGPECQLCFEDTGSLMWSGEVRWMTVDRMQRGSFRACGHLFTPPACSAAAAAAAAAAAVGGSSSSSSEAYWLRYCRLPAVLEFVVGQRAKGFEEAVWQAPASAGSTS
jgi:hypothetical protein